MITLITLYNTDKSGLEKRTNDASKNMTDTSGLDKRQIIILRSLRYIGKVPSITSLAVTAAFKAVDKIPEVSNLVKKRDYDAKISDPESK